MTELSLEVFSRNRILAIDDESFFRDMLASELSRAGIDHTILEDEIAAIDALTPGSYTGVITDGLYGGWRDVFEAADAIGARVVLLSSDDKMIATALQHERLAIDKGSKRSFESAIQAVLL